MLDDFKLMKNKLAFIVSELFATGVQGAWYDPSVLNSMFQDSAGTTPAVVGQPVGRINDLSGRNNHALQTVAGSRPTLRQNGAGKNYIEFDGVDDSMVALFTVAQPWERVSALQQVTSVGEYIFGGGNDFAGILLQTTSPNIALYDGANAAENSGAALATNVVITERHNGAGGRLAINNNAYTTGDSGAGLPGGITLGGSHNLAAQTNIHLYGCVMINRALTLSEIASLRTTLGAKCGIIL